MRDGDPRWLIHAFKDKGLKETPGKEDNPRIVQMHDYTSLSADDDETAWCSSGVCAWMEESGIKSTRSAAAISWATWGIKLDDPRRGCVCIIRQKKKKTDKATGSTSGNHVALWLGEEGGNRVRLWGCNQSDSCKESSFSFTNYEIIGYRWPEGEPT